MIVHECHDFFRACAELDDAAERLSQIIPPDKILDGNDPVFVLPAIEKTVKILEVLDITDGGFEVDVRTVYDHVKSLFGGVWYGIFDIRADELARDYKRVREGLFAEIKRHKFLYLPAPGETHFNQERLFGDAVYDKFPSARNDVREAGNAFAFEMYTACVFHAMAVLQVGLYAMANDLGVSFKHSIELAEWQGVIKGIEDKIEPLRHMPKTDQRDDLLSFFSGCASQFRYFKDAWRNHVAHMREVYDRGQAESILLHVKDFMQQVSTRLQE
jgi:hypothetical protein